MLFCHLILSFLLFSYSLEIVYNLAIRIIDGDSVKIVYSGDTNIGQKRKTNQDSICLLPENDFFAVADGMGGHNGGDIASQMSVQLFKEYFSQHAEKKQKNLGESIIHINKSIYNHGQRNQELKGMGTTITAVQFDEKFANVANIGDSRVYLISNDNLYQLTRDHSLVQEKLNLGIYDRKAAKQDPQKNVLIRTVGFEENVEVDIYKYRLNDNDLFLLCSDGLHGKVCDEDVLKIVQQHVESNKPPQKSDLDNAVEHLIYQANLNGGQDNISVILVSFSK